MDREGKSRKKAVDRARIRRRAKETFYKKMSPTEINELTKRRASLEICGQHLKTMLSQISRLEESPWEIKTDRNLTLFDEINNLREAYEIMTPLVRCKFPYTPRTGNHSLRGQRMEPCENREDRYEMQKESNRKASAKNKSKTELIINKNHNRIQELDKSITNLETENNDLCYKIDSILEIISKRKLSPNQQEEVEFVTECRQTLGYAVQSIIENFKDSVTKTGLEPLEAPEEPIQGMPADVNAQYYVTLAGSTNYFGNSSRTQFGPQLDPPGSSSTNLYADLQEPPGTANYLSGSNVVGNFFQRSSLPLGRMQDSDPYKDTDFWDRHYSQQPPGPSHSTDTNLHYNLMVLPEHPTELQYNTELSKLPEIADSQSEILASLPPELPVLRCDEIAKFL